MSEAGSAAHKSPSEAARSRRRLGLRAGVTAAFLGAGFALWWACVVPWRTAMVGVPLLPLDERLLASVAVVVGAAIGVAVPARRRSSWPLSVMLVAAVVTAAVAVLSMTPRTAAMAAPAILVLALPLAAASALLSALVAGCGSGASAMLAFVGLGAAIAAVLDEGLLGAEFAPLLAVASCAWLAAAAGAPTEEYVSRRGVARAMPALALPAGAVMVWTFLVPRGFGSQPMPWPGGDCVACGFAACALGFAIAAKVPPAHVARGSGLCTALLAAFAAASDCDAALRTAGIGIATAFLLAAAIGAARPRELLAAATRAALGAIVAMVACVYGFTIGVAVAVLAVAASLALVRATAFGGFSTVAGGFAVVVFGGATSTSAGIEDIEIAALGAAQASWSSRTQEVLLRVAGHEVDRSGPQRDHAALLVFAAMAFAKEHGTVVVLGPHSGRLRERVRDFGLAAATFVEPSTEVASLQPRLQVDGPLPPEPGSAPTTFPAESDAAIGSRAFAYQVPVGSCSAIVDGTLIGSALPERATVAEHAAMRRAAANGAVVQAVALEWAPREILEAAIRSSALVHPWCGVFLFGRTLLVCGLSTPPDWDRVERTLASLPPSARWQLHAAGLGSTVDLQAAFLAEIAPEASAPFDDVHRRAHSAPAASADATLADNAAALAVIVRSRLDATGRARLQALVLDPAAWAMAEPVLAKAMRERPESVSLRRELLAVAVRMADRAIAASDPAQPAKVAEAASLAARFYHLGSPSPTLQAALALPDRKDQRIRERRIAGRAALALDAGFAAVAPPVLLPVVSSLQAHTPLADWNVLPASERLAELATGDGPLAIALRRRFGSRCAEALVSQWGHGELSSPMTAALRELADPFVLEAAAAALASRSAEAELLRIWRADLPATKAVRAFADGGVAMRQALQIALAGRTDRASLSLLGRGLVDDELSVRTAAGAALFRSIGERIVYDPEWPVDRLRDAAAQLAEHSQLQRTPR